MPDASEVLFEITKAHLNTGLRGIPVGTVRTSSVDPYKGLHYVGYPVMDIWEVGPEAAVYLLLHKELPTDEQLAGFKANLVARAKGFDTSVFALLKELPKEGHPMEWLNAGLNFMGMTTKTGDYREDGLNVIARLPQLVAAIFRIRSGWGDPIPSKPELGLMENFVHMLGVPGGDNEKLTKMMRVFYTLHLDHGGGNLSTFSGKAVASGLADMYASLGASMAGLSGPRHGRANQDCLNFLRTVGTTDPDEIEAFVRQRLANKQLIFGFGHAVLRAEDPRATIQYALGHQICPDDDLFKTAIAMRERAVKVLKENPKVSNPYPNVDAISGTLLQAVGLEDSDFYTTLFGLSRCSGIAAQVIDERLNFRNGKGVAIYRCKFIAENQPRRG
ncbi:MAG: citrate (Si)-synthase [Proteobacteria bacterium]|nr:citrate (Si)-synthase [Pseudomonadota bacterium]MCP4915529.1 citrate (Si)-synthase [Pseudomonadota bacterium]